MRDATVSLKRCRLTSQRAVRIACSVRPGSLVHSTRERAHTHTHNVPTLPKRRRRRRQRRHRRLRRQRHIPERWVAKDESASAPDYTSGTIMYTHIQIYRHSTARSAVWGRTERPTTLHSKGRVRSAPAERKPAKRRLTGGETRGVV